MARKTSLRNHERETLRGTSSIMDHYRIHGLNDKELTALNVLNRCSVKGRLHVMLLILLPKSQALKQMICFRSISHAWRYFRDIVFLSQRDELVFYEFLKAAFLEGRVTSVIPRLQ